MQDKAIVAGAIGRTSHLRILRPSGMALAVFTLGAVAPISWAQEAFDELMVRVEINASDGDAGFHAKHDGEGWRRVTIHDPDGDVIFKENAKRNEDLGEQGITENFFESAEPPCNPEEPDAVPLAEFLDRFEAGNYHFRGRTIEDGTLLGEAELTHNLPAAPDISAFDESTVDPHNTVITWASGADLGECQDDDLVAQGTIPDPATVEVVRWEVTVEPDKDALEGGELPDGVPFSVFNVQLLPSQTTVTVPAEYLNSYANAGVRAFKFEVGAKEASDNQTFSEGTFTLINGG